MRVSPRLLARLAEKDSRDELARRREAIEYRLRQSGFSFESALEEAGGLGGRTLLLIVDQFEELFRFGLAGLGMRRAGIGRARARDEATQFVQILLDADRRRLKDVRVLITMRSDFIGDCAYFQGLSEAVSATQYLAPNLTRSQLEDVIRKPIEKAGATIEPELVERLLNDSGDELDQLPVMQHCLMRLWDRAGAASAEGPRRVTRQTYDDIGRMAESLSRHADEILRQCAGKEVAVEQAFRALSEVDREGRAIRRALRFDKLLAETGVAEADLRAVLDKFRAPTCSFLVPPPSTAPILASDERIDIGHETLLRRWKKLAGEIEKVEATTGRPPEGWLAREQVDGQRYRTLVSLLEGGASGEMATLNDPELVKRRWDSLPRTLAWAERYGGKFEDVRKLIDGNIAAKQRARRNQWYFRTAAFAIVLFAGGAVALTWWQLKAREETAKQEQLARVAEIRLSEETARLREQAKAASQFLHDFLDAYHKGQITEPGAVSLMPLVDHFSAQVGSVFSPPEAGKLWVETLNVNAELLMSSDDPDAAPRMARTAEQTAQRLAELYPDSEDVLQSRFDSLMRTGDALMGQLNTSRNVELSLDEYRHALITAESLTTLGAEEWATDDSAKAHLRLGDTYLRRSPPAREDALHEYRDALAATEARIEGYSGKHRRDQAAAKFRIGLVLADLGSREEADVWLNEAKKLQQELIKNSPDDKSLKWDLADTYMELGDQQAKKNAQNEAYDQYKKGVALREEVVRDPGNVRYMKQLAVDYDEVVGVIETLNQTNDDDARRFRRDQYENLKELANKDSANPEWQARLGLAAKRRGDLAELEKYKLRMYAEALTAWTKLAASPKGAQLLRDRYKDHIQIADAFAHGKQWADASAAYKAAANIAGLNLAAYQPQSVWEARMGQALSASEFASEAAAWTSDASP